MLKFKSIHAGIIAGMLLFHSPALALESIQIRLDIIRQIESSNNPLAYNKRSGARGLYQITDICLADYNLYHKDKLTLESLWEPKNNKRVAVWYIGTRIPQLLRHYFPGEPITLEKVLWAYNAGIGKVKAGIMPKETRDYITKYKARLSHGL